MNITKAFRVAFDRMAEKNWEKIYVMVDIHDTILRACYEQEETYDYFPRAKQALQLLTQRKDICLILWTACDQSKLNNYMQRFEQDGIHFDYANANPEVGNTELSCFDNKFYFNVGIDDKFGFDGENDWDEVISVLNDYVLTERTITVDDSDDEEIKSLYQSAFPDEEQIPWDDLMRLVGEMPLDFTAYYQGEELIGFTIVYPRKAFNWYWYFAVREELRGKGYGQAILSKLLKRYQGQSGVLDMESPTQECDNIEQRKHRRAFYQRNGFRDTNVYRTYNGITMTIMMMGPGTFTMQDWDEIVSELKRYWWPKELRETTD